MAENVLKIVHEGLTQSGTGGGGAKGSENETGSVSGMTGAITAGIAAGGVGGAIIILLEILLKFVPFVEFMTSALGDINTVMGLFLKMLGLLVKPFVNLFIPLFLMFIFILMPWVKLMNILLTPVLVFLMSFLKEVGPKMMEDMDMMVGFLQKIGAWLGELVGAIMDGDWDKVWGLISGAAEEIWAGIVGGIETAIPYIKTALEGIWGGIKDIKIGELTVEEWVESFKTTLQGAWDFITGLFSTEEGEENPLLAFIKDPLATLITWVGDTFTGEMTDNLEAFSEIALDVFDILWNKLLQGASDAMANLIGFVIDAIKAIASVWNQAMEITGGPKMDVSDLTSALSEGRSVLQGQSAHYGRLASEAELKLKSDVYVTINGDVSGENAGDKLKAMLEKHNNWDFGEFGVQ